MSKINMKDYGLSDRFIAESKLYDLSVGRIISQDKGAYKAVTENGEFKSQISGKLRYNSMNISDFPAVGDFVMLDENDGNAVIHHILNRKSAFIRKAAGTSNNDQVVAANVDTIFICMSLNRDFNLRRLERYISIGWDSGAIPVVVLTKSDLCSDIDLAPRQHAEQRRHIRQQALQQLLGVGIPFALLGQLRHEAPLVFGERPPQHDGVKHRDDLAQVAEVDHLFHQNHLHGRFLSQCRSV